MAAQAAIGGRRERVRHHELERPPDHTAAAGVGVGPVADLAAGRVHRVGEPEDADARQEPVVGGSATTHPTRCPSDGFQLGPPDEVRRVVLGVGMGEVGEPVPGARVAAGFRDPRHVGVGGRAQPYPVVPSTGMGHHVGARPSVVGGAQRGVPGVAQLTAVRDASGISPWKVNPQACATRHDARLPACACQCTTGSRASSNAQRVASRTARAMGPGRGPRARGRSRSRQGARGGRACPRTVPCHRHRRRWPSRRPSSRGPCRARPPTPRRAAARRGAGSW